MNTKLINLLPPERQRALSREYYFRLGAVAAMFLTALAFAAALLLLPVYVYLTASAAAKEAHLANLESVFSLSDEQGLSTRLSALSSDAAFLRSLARAPAASARIRDALAVERPGVALSGFSYAPATPKNPGTLAVSGVAVTRDALRAYQIALQSAAFTASADLPVSAYAKDADIAFTITMSLAP